jgi:chemotaxis protein MotB
MWNDCAFRIPETIMPRLLQRSLIASLLIALLLSTSGCGCRQYRRRKNELRRAQLRTLQLYRENQDLAGQAEMAGQLAEQNGQLEQSLAAAQQNLDVANQRLENLSAERAALNEKYSTLLTGLKNPLGGGTNRRFEELAKKYPEFEFDPVTGVSRFNGDLLFPSGSDVVRPEGVELLREFASIMNDPDAKQFHILVVGHTDDQEIVKAGTRAKHETNWDLSAHRSTAVVKSLAKIGLDEPRMGVAGYNKFQPVTANADDSGRQQNRRVEIYILAPDATVAGWDGPSMVR